MIVDPPTAWSRKDAAVTGVTAAAFTRSRNAAVYFPRIRQPDPLRDGPDRHVRARRARSPASSRAPTPRAASGRRRPASTRRSTASSGCSVTADRPRERRSSTRSASTACATLPAPATWSGARAPARATTRLASEWKYLPVRRTALFLEESPVPRHAVGRVRAERRAAVGADPAQRRRLHAQPVPPGRVPGHDAARGATSSSATARRRRRTTSTSASSTSWSASRRSSRPSSSSSSSSRWPARAAEERDGPVHRQRPALRPVQELQVPGEVGRPLRRRASARSARSSAPPRWSSTARAATRRPSRKSPGRTKYEAITLERGVTHDTEFEAWANKVWNFGAGLGAEVSLKDFRKDLIIELYNEAGQLVLAYKVYRGWVSEYQALPDLDANANAVAIQTHQARERGLGARLRRGRAERAAVHRAVDGDATRMGVLAGRDLARPVGTRPAARARVERALALARGRGDRRRGGRVAGRLPVGARDAAAARACAAICSDRALEATAPCPACGEEVEFAVDVAALAASRRPRPIAPRCRPSTVGGRRVALPTAPTVDDLAALDGPTRPSRTRRALRCSRRCVDGADEPTPAELPDERPRRGRPRRWPSADPLAEVLVDARVPGLRPSVRRPTSTSPRSSGPSCERARAAAAARGRRAGARLRLDRGRGARALATAGAPPTSTARERRERVSDGSPASDRVGRLAARSRAAASPPSRAPLALRAPASGGAAADDRRSSTPTTVDADRARRRRPIGADSAAAAGAPTRRPDRPDAVRHAPAPVALAGCRGDRRRGAARPAAAPPQRPRAADARRGDPRRRRAAAPTPPRAAARDAGRRRAGPGAESPAAAIAAHRCRPIAPCRDAVRRRRSGPPRRRQRAGDAERRPVVQHPHRPPRRAREPARRRRRRSRRARAAPTAPSCRSPTTCDGEAGPR